MQDGDLNPLRYCILTAIFFHTWELNAFSLLRIMRKERDIMLLLTSLGLTPEQAVDLVTHPEIYQAQSSQGDLDNLFDASDRLEGGDVILWWNDIEKDSR